MRNLERAQKSFTYEVTEDGKIEATGRVKYDEVITWYVVEKELANGSNKLFIADLSFSNSLYDVHNGKSIGGSHDSSVLQAKMIAPYLVTYDMVYDSYTIEDVDQLLEFIEADFEYTIPKESDKIMIKTNE